MLPGFTEPEAAELVDALLAELTAHLAAEAVAEARATLQQIQEVTAGEVTNRTDTGYIALVAWAIEAALASFKPSPAVMY